MPTAQNPTKLTPRHMALALFLAVVGHVTVASGQGFGQQGYGSTPAAPRPAPLAKPRQSTGGLTEFATEDPVTAIQIRGNKTVPASRITGQMLTRVGRPYDPKTLARDVRKLNTLPYFVSVRPLMEQTEAGRIVVLEVVERSTIRYVEFLGNEAISNRKLAEEMSLRVGGAVDPYAVEEGRRKLLELYKSNGFGRAVVSVEEGQQASDHGVTYVINEGPKQRVWHVEFEGNTFASDGQLKTKIKTKPTLLRLWGGKIQEDEVQADLNRITDYYRSFGFFRARVGRTVDYNDEGEWATIRFVIDEGERYSVRNVTFLGVEKFSQEDMTAGLQQGAEVPFERRKLNADLEWVQELYGSKGYVFADVKAETVFLEEPGKVDLVYKVSEGKRWRVGRVYVNIGGESSHTRIQTALNRVSIRPGDVVDTRELKASERRLRASSLFNSNPAQGAVPKISYQIPEREMTRLAKETSAQAEFRGQSPQEGSVDRPQRHTAYKPPYSVYQVQQATGATPEATLAQSNLPYTAPPTPVYAVPSANGRQPAYGGQVIAPTGPATAPVGSVNTLAVAPPTAHPVVPAQYGAPVYNGPAYPANPGNAVNTQLFPSPIFAPTPVPPPNDPSVDLYVNLEETQTGRFMVGVAVNSDAGLVGQILLDEQNFDWRRPPKSMQDVLNGTAWRGGGQRFRLEAAPGTQVQRYIASWQEPYLMDTPISLNLSGSFFDRRFDDWDEQRLGGRIGLGYQWTANDLSAQLTYRGETVNIHDILADNLVIPEYAEMNGNNELHGLGVRIVNDTRDNPFLATEGYYLSATLEQVAGTFDYSRAELEGRTYFLLKERPDHTGRHVMVYQTRLGFTGSNTPVYDRFFAGGFSTMRGFDFRGAGPVRGPNNSQVGGDFRWLNTIEYLFPLTADGMINGIAFCDFGTVNESVKLDNFRVSPGIGLRLTVPAMGPAPIALDFAWPQSHEDTDDRQVFTFNVGFMR